MDKVLFTKSIAAGLSLNIYSVDEATDEVTYGFSDKKDKYEAKIEYDSSNEQAYIVIENGDRVYLEDFEKVSETLALDTEKSDNNDNVTSDDNNDGKKASIYETLTDEDIESLSNLNLTEDEISVLLNLLELTLSEKDKAMNLVELLFKGKKLVAVESQDEEGKVSESYAYTCMLLGDI